MDRAALAREWFDIAQEARSELGSLKLEAGMARADLPGHVAASASKLTVLVERFDKILAGYVASSGSGATRITVEG